MIISRHKIIDRFTGTNLVDMSGHERYFNDKCFDLFDYVPKLHKEGGKFNWASISKELYYLFFESEFLNKPQKVSYKIFYNANLMGLGSYKTDYQSDPTQTAEEGKGNGLQIRQVIYNVRDKKLSHHRLDLYIQSALLLRDKESKQFYAGIDSRKETEFNYYQNWQQAFEKLLVLLCEGNGEKILAQLNVMIETDYSENDKLIQQPHLDFREEMSIYFNLLFTPLLRVYQAIFESNEALFNQNLLEALEKHRHYYETAILNEGEDLRDNPEGWVSLALTAACAVAHDRGMKREIQSDYIPEWLVKGNFEGLELIVE